MKKLKVKTIFLSILLYFVVLIAGCSESTSNAGLSFDSNSYSLYGNNYKEENTKADKSNIYGMDCLAWSDKSWENIDYTYEPTLFKNMGVKSVRTWMHCNWLMNDPFTFNKEGLSLAKDIVNRLFDSGFQVIGMNHSDFYKTDEENYSSGSAKPVRDITKGSYYMNWLNDYETTWYNIVSQFPKIEYWEIDNEPNNDVFMPKIGGGTFSLSQKARIYTDMMYFASRGIHRANPQANTVMGGLVVWGGPENFMQYIYDDISDKESWSVYPDDYFQVACWHPYMNEYSDEGFKKINDDLYDVIKANEGKDKKVFLTEAGFSESDLDKDKIPGYIKSMYALLARDLPYVESLHYFRPFDDLRQSALIEKRFGLFTDPILHGNNNENPYLASPKPAAYAYQKIASGTGSLTIMKEALN